MKSTAIFIGGFVALVALLAVVNRFVEGGGSSPRSGPRFPPDEVAFCAAVSSAADGYKRETESGRNEIKLDMMRETRKRAIAAALPVLQVKGWLATVQRIDTSGVDGAATVEMMLPCGAEIKTWNNSFSDAKEQTMVPKGTPLYRQLANVGKGQSVVIDGEFFEDEKDTVRETSITQRGSMTDPEFVFRFASVRTR